MAKTFEALDLEYLVLEAWLFSNDPLLELAGSGEHPVKPLLRNALGLHKAARKHSSLAHKEKNPAKRLQLHKQAGLAHKEAAHHFKKVLAHVPEKSKYHAKIRKFISHHHYIGKQHSEKAGS